MQNTKIKALMEDNLIAIDPDATLCEAALKMSETDSGCLFVGQSAKPEGIITDRDIVVRAVAHSLDPAKEKVRDAMTAIVFSCNIKDSLATTAELMREKGVGRLGVTDDDGYTCGVISFGRILRNHDDAQEVSKVVACATGRKTGDAPEDEFLAAAVRA